MNINEDEPVFQTDDYYNELKEMNDNVDKKLLGLVRCEFYNKLYVRKKTGKFRRHYNHNCSMKEFVLKIADVYGNIEKMDKSLTEVAYRIARIINKKSKKNKFSKEQVKQCISIVIFWENYIAFKDIDMVYSQLNNSGYFKVYESNTHYTDLRVKLKHESYKEIGIKLKPKNYIYISEEKKKEHLKQQNVSEHYRYGTYYLFYNDEFKPFSAEDKGIMLFKNKAVCDERDKLREAFIYVCNTMELSEYKHLTEQILIFFYKKNNLGMDNYLEWKKYIKDYESDDDFRKRMNEQIEIELLNKSIGFD